MSRRWPALLLACSMGACSEAPEQPSLLLITLDTLRADVLGMYGAIDSPSPHLDAFAKRATVFEHAITSMGTTFPAHASLFTGLYPIRHGVRWNGDALDSRLETLAERLADVGYETAAFVSMTGMLRRGGLRQGFFTANDDQIHAGGHPLPGEEINRLALPWLESRTGRPFFLWLHYAEPHSPYLLTEYARARFEEGNYAGPFAEGASTMQFYALNDESKVAAEDLQALWTLYRGEVNELDRNVGQILETLEREGLLDRTVVVIAADHGQSLGEHGVFGHGFLLLQEVLQVPLMLRDPSYPDAPGRVSTRVSLIDVLPTVLGLLGLEREEEIDGRSLAGSLTGANLEPRRYFAEVRELRDNRRYTELDALSVAVFEESIKAVWRPDRSFVVDLESNPKESELLRAHVPAALRDELLTLAAGYLDASPEHGPPLPLTREAEKELRALGYID